MRMAPALSSRATSVASCSAGGAVAIDLRAGAGRQALDVEQVLDREGRAGERAERLAARPRRVDRVGLGERARRRHVGEGAERGVARLDARERGRASPRGRSPRRS